MPRLRVEAEPGPGAASNSVEGWLRMFVGLLRLPAKQAAEIREELDGHLRERVRDLLLTGMSEAAAMRRAVEELGEAAEVAGRYRALRVEPQRRMIMQATALAVAGAALALSIVAFSGTENPPGGAEVLEHSGHRLVLEPEIEDGSLLRLSPRILEEAGRPLIDSHGIRLEYARRTLALTVEQPLVQVLLEEPDGGPRFEVGLETSLEGAFKALGEALGRPVNVQWGLLENVGAARDMPVSLRAEDATVAMVLRWISDGADLSGGHSLDYRLTEKQLGIGTREYFDRREREVVVYDLSGIVAARFSTYDERREDVVEEVTSLIRTFVSPEDWREHGGELAEMQVVGDRMFVKAPRRMHPQIEWILGQLPVLKARGAAEEAEEARRYSLQHTAAEDALAALSRLRTIRQIDFTTFATDARTNSIIGRTTPELHERLLIALEALDRPSPSVLKGRLPLIADLPILGAAMEKQRAGAKGE